MFSTKKSAFLCLFRNSTRPSNKNAAYYGYIQALCLLHRDMGKTTTKHAHIYTHPHKRRSARKAAPGNASRAPPYKTWAIFHPHYCCTQRENTHLWRSKSWAAAAAGVISPSRAEVRPSVRVMLEPSRARGRIVSTTSCSASRSWWVGSYMHGTMFDVKFPSPTRVEAKPFRTRIARG